MHAAKFALDYFRKRVVIIEVLIEKEVKKILC